MTVTHSSIDSSVQNNVLTSTGVEQSLVLIYRFATYSVVKNMMIVIYSMPYKIMTTRCYYILAPTENCLLLQVDYIVILSCCSDSFILRSFPPTQQLAALNTCTPHPTSHCQILVNYFTNRLFACIYTYTSIIGLTVDMPYTIISY